MVLWNRIVRNLENAKELTGKWITIFAERIRIEVDVAKILIEKGKIERQLDLSYRKIGERAFQAIESEGEVNLADSELAKALEDAREAHREMARLQSCVHDLTRTGLVDETYLKESNP